MTHIPLPNIDVHRKLNAKRLLAFGIVAMLLLTVFTVMFVKPGNPQGAWWFAPGTHTQYVRPGSSRNITITIGLLNTTTGGPNMTLAAPASSVVYPTWDSYDVVMSAPDGSGLVNLTVPKESFNSKPFYLRPVSVPELPTIYTWGKLEQVADGNGTIDTVGGNIDVDMYVTVTGYGNGTYAPGVRTIVPGSTGSAGSLRLDMPLNLTVYVGVSPTNSTWQADLVEIPFPVWLTTGKTNVTITDSAPFPTGTDDLDGYKTSAQGVPVDPYNGSVTIVACGGGVDLYFDLLGTPLYNDFMFNEVESLALQGTGPWWFVPGTYMTHAQLGSSRNMTITIGLLNTTTGGPNMTLAAPAASIAYPVCDRYNVTFGEPDVNGLVNVTVPQASFISAPFYLRAVSVPELPTMYTWGQLEAVADGNGTLALQGGVLDVDLAVTVTGYGNGTYAPGVRTVGDGTPDPAGSMLLDMHLNLTIYIGVSPTNSTWQADLTEIPFPVWLTTGKTNVTITDSSPFPKGTDDLDGYKTSAQGSPTDPYNASTTLAACGGGIDLYFDLLGTPLYNDFMFKEIEIISQQQITEATVFNTEAYKGQKACNRIYGSGAGVNQFGYTANVTITIKAEGPATVTIYTKTINNVAPGQIIEIDVNYDTTNEVPGTYTVKVYTRGQINVHGTIIVGCDTWVAGTVRILMPGDFDGNGDVDSTDYNTFAQYY